MTEALLFVLVLTNSLQFWFWSRQNNRLVDKLMSRNYADYVQSQTAAHPKPPLVNDEDLRIEDTDILRELNRALPS